MQSATWTVILCLKSYFFILKHSKGKILYVQLQRISDTPKVDSGSKHSMSCCLNFQLSSCLTPFSKNCQYLIFPVLVSSVFKSVLLWKGIVTLWEKVFIYIYIYIYVSIHTYMYACAYVSWPILEQGQSFISTTDMVSSDSLLNPQITSNHCAVSGWRARVWRFMALIAPSWCSFPLDGKEMQRTIVTLKKMPTFDLFRFMVISLLWFCPPWNKQGQIWPIYEKYLVVR